jgi:pilus assembly protein Flp/PilA
MKQTKLRQSGQGMVEYALILALVALIVIVALIATGSQVMNLYSDIIGTMHGQAGM